jgi:hypothetical protein
LGVLASSHDQTRRGRSRLHWVAELLNSEVNDWDYNTLHGLFNAVDLEATSRIRLASRRTEDFVAWHLEKSGIFSVIMWHSWIG